MLAPNGSPYWSVVTNVTGNVLFWTTCNLSGLAFTDTNLRESVVTLNLTSFVTSPTLIVSVASPAASAVM